MYQTTYYVTYLGICAALIFWLGRILHRAGRVLLEEAFPGSSTVVRAVNQLLDIGFYLMSVGYVAAWCSNYEDLHNLGEMTKMVSGRVGGLLLLLGVVHLFNLLLLALFRRRAPAVAAPVAS
jgi:hypothetical protein